MAGHSTYVPASGFERWLDSRLPIMRLMHDTMTTFPTPRNLNIWYTFGGILTFCLAVQIVTGIVLAMHYVPSADLAFNSVEGRIMREVNYGWLIRYIHANGASMFFFAVYIHMFRGLYYGSYKAPREVLWLLGVLIYVLMMATAFFGYVLPWGQMSFWGATVITSLFSALDQVIPHLGSAITTWLWGDFAVGDATLNRFFSLHYLLPFVIAGVVGLHIWALHVPGNNNPLGIDVKGPQDTLPFHPYYTVKDAFYLSLFIMLFAAFVFFAPDFFGNPDNAIQANPLVTPPDIVPEWYLLPFYAMLRSIPQKLIGVLVLVGALLTLAFIPWLDTSKVRSCRFRPLMKQCFWLLVADCVMLGYVGSQSADAALSLGGMQLPLVWLARLGTAYYYGFFWLIMPIVGLIETPKALPESIAKAVLGAKAKA
ncbi:MAG: cytochrome b N-terminal domain-containing protein [Alphaproteobacteria bacterium]|jgi:quinol-cytochrome oxidoreductase complex cytochrome b subunit|nr:cytochrome b N-terminal domain-containing protein [Alphaproteobacteria bacterium]MDE1984939.1 cytochrome b N-terminal domain-containing protein [Alphaproteobacteria bacterium]MDE2162283.1 cytochrome b N-terminal domain-containing protein [Alphaproteobacteria bacterium]